MGFSDFMPMIIGLTYMLQFNCYFRYTIFHIDIIILLFKIPILENIKKYKINSFKVIFLIVLKNINNS